MATVPPVPSATSASTSTATAATTPTSLADQLARTRLSSSSKGSDGLENGVAVDYAVIFPSTSPGAYFCEVRLDEKEGGNRLLP